MEGMCEETTAISGWGQLPSLPVQAIFGDVAIAAIRPKSNDSKILYPVGVCTVDIPPNETD